MTADRRSLVFRSIAALDDQASIEARSLNEVMAALAALGIDPEASIQAARKRAYVRSGPAERLLARLDDAEEIASEIDALETVAIGDVRAGVKCGVAASAVAKAKRHAGLPANVTALTRPERRFWGWGSSIVGIAACLLLFVMTRPDQPYRDDGPALDSAHDIERLSEQAIADDAELDRAFELTEEPVVAYDAEMAKRTRASSRSAAVFEESVQQTVPEAELAANPGKVASFQNQEEPGPAETVERLSRSLVDRAPTDERKTISSKAPPAIQAFAPPSKRGVERTSASITGQDALKAILIVDPANASVELRTLAQTVPKGGLARRLDEARAVLEGRPLIALLTMQRDGRDVDGAVTLREGVDLGRTFSSFAGSTAPEKRAEGWNQGVRLEIVDLPGFRDSGDGDQR